MSTIKQEKLLSHVVKTDSCWIWMGSKSRRGYGYVSRSYYGEGLAHRASWRLFRGTLSKTIGVCHRCNNPSCVNPDHLYLGDQKVNISDAWRDGLCTSFHGKKKVCPRCNGPYSRATDGTRVCVPCHRQNDALRRFARKEAAIAAAMQKEGK